MNSSFHIKCISVLSYKYVLFRVKYKVVIFCAALHSFRQDILQWKTSRRFFYWRLHRLLLEEELKRKIQAINAELSSGQIKSMLSRWFIEAQGAVKVSAQFALLFI